MIGHSFMKLIDFHAHSSGISRCCRLNGKEVVTIAKEYSYDGIVLSNHFDKEYIEKDGYDAFVNKYIAEYDSVKRYGDSIGLTVFFGVELTVEYDRRVHILLYGVNSDFLHKYQVLYDLSSKELYKICHENGIFVVHAHPYRNGTQPLPIDSVDGYEINCHPIYGNTYSSELLLAQKDNGMVLTCGCDYHGDSYRAKGGVLVPDDIKTDNDLLQYLFNTKQMDLQVHEINADKVYRISVTVER